MGRIAEPPSPQPAAAAASTITAPAPELLESVSPVASSAGSDVLRPPATHSGSPLNAGKHDRIFWLGSFADKV